MPPVELVSFLALLAIIGNIVANREKIVFPSTYYLLVELGCFIVLCFYVFLFFNSDAPQDVRSVLARYGYITILTPMSYPLYYILARKFLWKKK